MKKRRKILYALTADKIMRYIFIIVAVIKSRMERENPMKRSDAGRYEIVSTIGEQVRAFIPAPLPPEPALDIAAIQMPLERALLSLGRLDAISRISAIQADKLIFLYSYIRKEAALSSQIEGTQSSLSDLLMFERGGVPGVPEEDVREVSRCVAALEHGLQRLRGGFPLSNRLIRETHFILMESERGSDKSPGEFRRSQNWIGGTRPGNAYFVPPPPYAVLDCMSDLERFLHRPDIPALIKAGMAHVQFETIHPFLDGNGRAGRLLIAFMLCDAGVLREPLLYLSLYLKQNRYKYYRLLDEVRLNGDWEAWMSFFLDGVSETADHAVLTAQRLMDLSNNDQARIRRTGRVANSSLRVYHALKERLADSIPGICERTGLTFPTVSSALDRLVELGVAREITGAARNRIFVYDRYLAILNEGTEPL